MACSVLRDTWRSVLKRTAGRIGLPLVAAFCFASIIAPLLLRLGVDGEYGEAGRFRDCASAVRAAAC